MNECNLAESVCVRENEDCVNTSGSYKCICSEGFEEKDGTCVQTKAGERLLKSVPKMKCSRSTSVGMSNRLQ